MNSLCFVGIVCCCCHEGNQAVVEIRCSCFVGHTVWFPVALLRNFAESIVHLVRILDKYLDVIRTIRWSRALSSVYEVALQV